MSWSGVQGHDRIAEQFGRALAQGRLASSFLFVGPEGIGKFTFAQRMAQALLCEATAPRDLTACQTCSACQQVMARSHPDLVIVEKPADKSFIPIELLIGDREHRMREGLCHNIGLKPYRGGRKVAIIDDADFLNPEGANCLLKTLEEPPPDSVIILIGTSEQRQLPTIRSRCQVVRFRALSATTVAELLVEGGLTADAAQATRLAALSGGSLSAAAKLSDDQLGSMRQSLLEEMSRPDWDAVEFSKTLSQFVDEAGKDAPPRRLRMHQLIGFAAEFYRQLMRGLSGIAVEGDSEMQQFVAAACATWRGDAETAGACLQRCLDARAYIQANVNQANLLDWWLDELAVISRTGRDERPASDSPFG